MKENQGDVYIISDVELLDGLAVCFEDLLELELS